MKNKFFAASDIPLVIIYAARLAYPYRPFLDDYIQYHVYSLHANPIKDIFFGIGLFATRPAASFLDIALWSHFWENPGLIYTLFSILYLIFLFALRFHMATCGVRLGSVFMYLSALCPLIIEGTVWVSASTRIVGGLIVSAACQYLISEENNYLKRAAFVLINFLSYCFYEQAAIFCFVCVCFASDCGKKIFYVVVALINMVILAAWYLLFTKYSVFGYRTKISIENISEFPMRLVDALRAAFYVFADAKACFFLVPFAFAALWMIDFDFAKVNLKKVFFGIAVVVSSFAPIAASGANVPFRCLVVPLVGIFVLLDCMNGRVRKFFLCALCSLFVIVSINEFCNYYHSTLLDERFLDDLCDKISHGIEYDLSDAPVYYFVSPSNHAEHIAAITSSDWALTGAVRSRLGNEHFPIISLPNQN